MATRTGDRAAVEGSSEITTGYLKVDDFLMSAEERSDEAGSWKSQRKRRILGNRGYEVTAGGIARKTMSYPNQITGLATETTLLTQVVIMNAIIGPHRPLSVERLGPAALYSGLILGANCERTKRLLDILTLPLARMTKEMSLEARTIDLKALERSMEESSANGNVGKVRKKVEDFSMYYDGAISDHFFPADPWQELIRPVILIRNPTPDTFVDLVNESSQGCPVIVDDGDLIERVLSGRMDLKWRKMLNHIIKGIAGYDGHFNFPFKTKRAGQNEFRCFGFVGLCDSVESLALSDSPEAQALAKACLMHESRKDAPIEITATNWYQRYSGVMRTVVEARRYGKNLAVKIEKPEARRILEMESQLLEVAPQAHLLPRMLVHAFLLESPETEGLLRRALAWAERIAGAIHEVPSFSEIRLRSKKQKLLGYINEHSPCKWSTVARHYDIQKKEHHQDVLNALIAEGSVIVDEEGRFQARSVA